jgi:hypothetical protein
MVSRLGGFNAVNVRLTALTLGIKYIVSRETSAIIKETQQWIAAKHQISETIVGCHDPRGRSPSILGRVRVGHISWGSPVDLVHWNHLGSL